MENFKQISLNNIIEVLQVKLPHLKIVDIREDTEYDNAFIIDFFLYGIYLRSIQITIQDILENILGEDAYDIQVNFKKNENALIEGTIEIAFEKNYNVDASYVFPLDEAKLTKYGKEQVKKNREELLKHRHELKQQELKTQKKYKHNKKIKEIIRDLQIELRHKQNTRQDFRTDMEQELVRISNENDQEKQAQIWGVKLDKIDKEIDTLRNKIKAQESKLQESVIKVIKESAFEDKLKEFIDEPWHNNIEIYFTKQIKKYIKNIEEDTDKGAEYVQKLQKKNKRLLQTNCSDKFLDDLNQLTTDYAPNAPTDNSSLDLSNEFPNHEDNDDKDLGDEDFDSFFTPNKNDDSNDSGIENNDQNNNEEDQESNQQNNDQKDSGEIRKESISLTEDNLNELEDETPYFNKKTEKLYSDAPYITEDKRFVTEQVRVSITSKRRGKIPSVLIDKIIEVLKNNFYLDRRSYYFEYNAIIVKKLPLEELINFKRAISNIDSSLEVKLIGLYSDKKFVMQENKKEIIESKEVFEKLFSSDPEFILGRLDEFFHDSENETAENDWENYKSKLGFDYANGYSSWMDYLEENNSTGKNEINVALSIIKVNDLMPSLKRFLMIKESFKKNIKENYLNFPTRDYCYEVKADMTFNPYNTNKNPKLYFTDESTAKNFVNTQKAGHCEYVGKTNLHEMKIKQLGETLIKKMKTHNWDYSYSSKEEIYKNGLNEEREIKQLVSKLNELTNTNKGTKLYNKVINKLSK